VATAAEHGQVRGVVVLVVVIGVVDLQRLAGGVASGAAVGEGGERACAQLLAAASAQPSG